MSTEDSEPRCHCDQCLRTSFSKTKSGFIGRIATRRRQNVQNFGNWSVSTSLISISMSSASSPLTLGFLVRGKWGNLTKMFRCCTSTKTAASSRELVYIVVVKWHFGDSNLYKNFSQTKLFTITRLIRKLKEEIFHGLKNWQKLTFEKTFTR